MTIFLLIIHTVVCFFLIFIVLIQSSKGAEMGAAFGGSSQTLFGSRGAATFLSKLTTISAIVFMVTSLVLAVFSARGGSVIKNTLPLEQKTQQRPFQTVPQQGPIQAPPQRGPAQPAQQSPPSAK
ncbi:MAG: preprotein translocase subunit SecG [Thermodesulfovibrionales bacterium]|jgi:preprotein translocase subunit SecG